MSCFAIPSSVCKVENGGRLLALPNPFRVGPSRCQLLNQNSTQLSPFPCNSTRFPGPAFSSGGWRAKMAMPVRPRFILFGSSIVQLSFGDGGWGATLANTYSRQADFFLRGYGGWTSRQALQVLNEVFPKENPIQPSLVIVYFGGNDSTLPHPSGWFPHVPLPEFIDNMTKIALHIKSLSKTIRVIFLSVPPVNSDQIRELSPVLAELRTMESCGIYSEAIIEICKKLDIKYVDLFNEIQKRENWLTTSFTDGFHFTAAGSDIVAEEILKVLKEANWEPSLHWGSMPIEYDQITSYFIDTPDGRRVVLD